MRQAIRQLSTISWKDTLVSSLPTLLVIAVAIWAGMHFIDPAPPRRIVIATGTDDSAYADMARAYQAILAEDGVTLELQASGGAMENLNKLRNENDESRVAFLQDGLADTQADDTEEASVDLQSLGSVSYEPIWIFYRGQHVRHRMADLAGLRIGIGDTGSATHVFASRLLAAGGITARNAALVSAPHEQAQKLLTQGHIDAAFFVGAPDSELIRTLAHQRHLHIMNLDQAPAYSRTFPYLHALVLPHGTIDIAHNLPAQDLQLLATTTTVVVSADLHPALVALLMKAMHKTHGTPSLLHGAREFPAAKDTDFPLSPQAAHFYQSGPPFLQRYLPFWLATLVDRAALALLPILAILIPVLRTAPTIYAWRIRRRIYRWYGELKYLEIQLRKPQSAAERAALITQVDQIEEKVTHASLPLAFAEHVYILKEHTELVRRTLQRGTNSTHAAPA